MNETSELVPVGDMKQMALAVAKSGLFGMKTEEQALALMIVAQAEGRHPGSAAADYHIIQGRPSLKADTMLARFQRAGGKVEWHDYTDRLVCATFSHPNGGSLRVDWDTARARQANLNSPTWRNYPRQMLRARVISEGIRAVYPAVLSGMYTPEEAESFTERPASGRVVEPAVEEVPGKPVAGAVASTPEAPSSAGEAPGKPAGIQDADYCPAAGATNAASPASPATASLPTSADPIPDIEREEPEDLDLERVLVAHETVVNGYLFGIGKIKHGQTFRSLSVTAPDYRARILGNPVGFIQVAQKRSGKGAAA